MLLPLFMGSISAPKESEKVPRELCEIFGYVYLEQDPRRGADYTYYVEESEFSSDLVVFWQENPLYASSSGLWYETKDPFEAHFTLRRTKKRSEADFIVYFTEYEYRAGCSQ